MINFQELVSALQAHPDIWLARAQILPGASLAAIAKAEAQLCAPLNPEIKAFYSKHNGLAIEWMFKQTDRFQSRTYEVDTSEVPFWMDLMEDYGPPFNGQIIVAPIGDVFVNSYEAIENPSNFDPYVSYVEYIEGGEDQVNGSFTFGERQFKSEASFRSQLRFFDHFTRDYGNLMLFETGVSDPPLLHLEDHWHNFDPKAILPLSKYVHHVAYNFGLRNQRGSYFRGAQPAPVSFEPIARLNELIDETEFPGDLRTKFK